jgi:hypothetical protein
MGWRALNKSELWQRDQGFRITLTEKKISLSSIRGYTADSTIMERALDTCADWRARGDVRWPDHSEDYAWTGGPPGSQEEGEANGLVLGGMVVGGGDVFSDDDGGDVFYRELEREDDEVWGDFVSPWLEADDEDEEAGPLGLPAFG